VSANKQRTELPIFIWKHRAVKKFLKIIHMVHMLKKEAFLFVQQYLHWWVAQENNVIVIDMFIFELSRVKKAHMNYFKIFKVNFFCNFYDTFAWAEL
jgi:hypothetical protein